MDRISTEHDPVLRQIDPEMLNTFSSSSQTLDFSSNFSRTNASNKHCENRLSLPEILSNIRSCRLQCFQPRLLNLQDSDSEECTSRKAGQTVNNKRVSAASVALLNTSKNGISGRQGFGCFWGLKYWILGLFFVVGLMRASALSSPDYFTFLKTYRNFPQTLLPPAWLALEFEHYSKQGFCPYEELFRSN